MKKYECENIDVPAQNELMPQGICADNHYSPRNPIPLIAVPGVKEMVEEAYRQALYDLGFKESKEHIDWMVSEYIQALEDNHE
jgi:hypothetical protein